MNLHVVGHAESSTATATNSLAGSNPESSCCEVTVLNCERRFLKHNDSVFPPY